MLKNNPDQQSIEQEHISEMLILFIKKIKKEKLKKKEKKKLIELMHGSLFLKNSYELDKDVSWLNVGLTMADCYSSQQYNKQ